MMKPYEQRFPWNLDWNLLRTYMVIVEQGGITSAADFLGLKQPTISSALKRLEETLDRKLIDRRPNHFSVTPSGTILYAECNSIFGAVSQLPALLSGLDDEVTGHVTIAMASHVVSPHFDEVLEKFNKLHGKVTYSISVAESAEVLNRVTQNRATLGICLLREPNPHLETQVLFREYFGLYCGPKHRLFGKHDIRLSELQGEDSVSFQTDIESGPLYSVTRLREQAMMKPDLKGISSNLPEVRRMIVSNIGIGALPVHVAQKDVNLGDLWQLPPYRKLPSVDIYTVKNPKRSFNPAEAALLKMLEDFLNETPMTLRTYH
jgi:DNA-binding transcriptional LysR family regulator